jgi:hypothetical protein
MDRRTKNGWARPGDFSGRAFKTASSAESEIGLVGGDRDTYLGVGGGPGALRSGDVRAAFEKPRGYTDGNDRRRRVQGLNGSREAGGIGANEDGNGVFELGARDAKIGAFGLCRLQRIFGLDEGDLIVDPVS